MDGLEQLGEYLDKAKYKRRWRSKAGRWEYEYDEPRKTPKKESPEALRNGRAKLIEQHVGLIQRQMDAQRRGKHQEARDFNQQASEVMAQIRNLGAKLEAIRTERAERLQGRIPGDTFRELWADVSPRGLAQILARLSPGERKRVEALGYVKDGKLTEKGKRVAAKLRAAEREAGSSVTPISEGRSAPMASYFHPVYGEMAASMDPVGILEEYLDKAGPYIGPKGGKWANPEHTIPWKDVEPLVQRERELSLKLWNKMPAANGRLLAAIRSRDAEKYELAAKLFDEVANLFAEHRDAKRRMRVAQGMPADPPRQARPAHFAAAPEPARIKQFSREHAEELADYARKKAKYGSNIQIKYRGVPPSPEVAQALTDEEHYLASWSTGRRSNVNQPSLFAAGTPEAPKRLPAAPGQQQISLFGKALATGPGRRHKPLSRGEKTGTRVGQVEESPWSKRMDEITALEEELSKRLGEGSRGGKIIGHTGTGKPIYEKKLQRATVRQHKKTLDTAKKNLAEAKSAALSAAKAGNGPQLTQAIHKLAAYHSSVAEAHSKLHLSTGRAGHKKKAAKYRAASEELYNYHRNLSAGDKAGMTRDAAGFQEIRKRVKQLSKAVEDAERLDGLDELDSFLEKAADHGRIREEEGRVAETRRRAAGPSRQAQAEAYREQRGAKPAGGGGPYIGPHGGKYKDPEHKVPWGEGKKGSGKRKKKADPEMEEAERRVAQAVATRAKWQSDFGHFTPEQHEQRMKLLRDEAWHGQSGTAKLSDDQRASRQSEAHWHESQARQKRAQKSMDAVDVLEEFMGKADDGKPGESLKETDTAELKATYEDLGHRLKAKPDDQALAARRKAIGEELARRQPPDFEKGDLTPEKARQILHDGTVHGQPITEQQRKYFGAVASGSAKKGMEKAMDTYEDGTAVLEDFLKAQAMPEGPPKQQLGQGAEQGGPMPQTPNSGGPVEGKPTAGTDKRGRSLGVEDGKKAKLSEDDEDDETGAMKYPEKPIERETRKSVLPADQRALTAREAAALERRLAKGEPDVVVQHPYSYATVHGNSDAEAEQFVKSLAETGYAGDPSLAPPAPAMLRGVLCKSCGCQHTAMLTACPVCGSGTVGHRPLPATPVGGNVLEKGPGSLLRPRVVEDVLIKG